MEDDVSQTSLCRPTWHSHLRAMLAIARKDFYHYVRYPLNALFSVLQPLIWLAPVYFLGKSFATAEGNVGFAAYAGTSDYMSFILLGSVLSQYLGAVLWGMGYSLKNEMDSGMLESNWIAPMSRPLLLVGRTLTSLAITTLQSAGVLLLGWLLFGFQVSGNVFAAVSAALPALVGLYGFGFAFAALVMLMRDPNTLIDVSNFLVSGLSGDTFPVNVLPRFLLPISMAIPLTYGYDAVRGYLLRTKTLLPIRVEVAILVGSMAVFVPLGYIVFKLVERRCRKLGTLGMH
jgi:ABC-2 type transport system permease protein